MKYRNDFESYGHGSMPGKKTTHCYTVEARKGDEHVNFYTVFANNRDQAARRVAKDGWEICSVNMTG